MCIASSERTVTAAWTTDWSSSSKHSVRRANDGRSASGYRRKHLYRHKHARRRRSGLWLFSNEYTSATRVCDSSGVTMFPRHEIASAASAGFGDARSFFSKFGINSTTSVSSPNDCVAARYPTRLYFTFTLTLMSSTTWNDAQFMLNPRVWRYVAFSSATAFVRTSGLTIWDWSWNWREGFGPGQIARSNDERGTATRGEGRNGVDPESTAAHLRANVLEALVDEVLLAAVALLRAYRRDHVFEVLLEHIRRRRAHHAALRLQPALGSER